MQQRQILQQGQNLQQAPSMGRRPSLLHLSGAPSTGAHGPHQATHAADDNVPQNLTAAIRGAVAALEME